jgi:thioredoxin reductase (NADPH)
MQNLGYNVFMKYDVLILGGGPSGLTAAIYTSRANLNTLVIAGQPAGGQLMYTTEVENWPGYVHGIMGPELIKNCREQAARFGANFVDENVVTLSGNARDGFVATTDEKKSYSADAVIIATGASAKWLGLESETRLKGRGVSACATCDGFFFKEKVIAVVGGGDSAMEEATYLTKFGKKVYIIARGAEDKLKASTFMLNKAKSNPKIEFIYKSEVVEVLGENSVEGLLVRNVETSAETEMRDVQGLFLAIGHQPNTKFLEGFLEIGKGGYLAPLAGEYSKTAVDGVFVAGDVADYKYRQAITAAGAGCMAALEAERYLEKKHLE